jgi:protein gp37
MADTHIEWSKRVWNPTTGCDRTSPGCDHCYALTMAKRLKGMGQPKYQNDGNPRTSGPGFGLTVHNDALALPLCWRKPSKVFVNSMSDLFHDAVPDEFIAKVFAVMAATPQHTYQILTKRHGRMRSLLRDECRCGSGHAPGIHFRSAMGWAASKANPDRIPGLGDDAEHQVYFDAGWPLPNVHLGVSAEDQKWADLRIPALLATPAAVRWVSAEPLLNPLSLRPGEWIPPLGGGPRVNLATPWTEPGPCLDWAVVGGESGPGARRMSPGWVRHLVQECEAAGTPIFVKQLGSIWARSHGADSKGGDPQFWPVDLRVREFPHRTQEMPA